MKGIGRIIVMREVVNIERKDSFFTSAPFCSSPTGQCEEWCQHVHAGGNLGARGAGFMEMALLKFTDTIKSSVFGHERDMHKIASNGSYVIDGALLTVDYWQQGLVLEHLFILRFGFDFMGCRWNVILKKLGFGWVKRLDRLSGSI
ncbi:hypothetical protein LOK49_LG02G02196 [Camellia lanceoleosa]|uniref:Uncharacterized protein n=1 Tax=Camellia lanceoleosa TaxID=1840588 RepID=A0ACC0IPH8_9ERIC|nr:hypothetical protein LOK49_LG02G02196 [Camellia lanceoleosa]